MSQDLYLHGFFSASIKLPADYSAGVVVAFYVSMEIGIHWVLIFFFSGNGNGNGFKCTLFKFLIILTCFNP